jgi:hypothetical protein
LNRINILFHFGEFSRDLDKTPAWANTIPRWSQLDDASYVVAEASFESKLDLKNITQVFLVSTQGSNATDSQFVNQDKVSAQTFVHTLPNVRALSFSLITGWKGAMWCLSKGESSLVNLLRQITFTADQSLIINFNRKGEIYYCDFIHVGSDNYTHQLISHSEQYDPELLLNDFNLRDNLLNQETIQLTRSLELRKKI